MEVIPGGFTASNAPVKINQYGEATFRETQFVSQNTVNPLLILKAADGQTADLLQFRNAAGMPLSVISQSGNIGIGTASPTERLSVTGNALINGNITTKKVIVTQTGWPDYVFEKAYSLMPLYQVEKFIETNKHLPGVPSAKEVEDKGVNIGDNQAVLLKKIEELTLYLIEIKKTNDHMLEKIASQEKEIDILKKRAAGKSGN